MESDFLSRKDTKKVDDEESETTTKNMEQTSESSHEEQEWEWEVSEEKSKNGLRINGACMEAKVSVQ